MRIVLILLLYSNIIFANQDTLRLSSEEYLSIIRTYHPVLKRAALLEQQAANQFKMAQGQFDPKISLDWAGKNFKAKSYYNLFYSELKIPTWYGIDVKASYTLHNGNFLNPENYTPAGGLSSVGVSIPLWRGLWNDERRTAIRQADLMKDMNLNEQKIILNELMYEALKAYWDWSMAYHRALLLQRFLNLSQERFENIKTTFYAGDRPAIDTLEAFIQVQDRLLQYREALLDYKNNSLALSNFLWTPNGEPLTLTNSLQPSLMGQTPRPDLPNCEQTNEWILENIAKHPALLTYDYQLNSLDLERKLKKEYLKPQINLNYNLLAEDINYFKNDNIPLWGQYKWGLEFSMPIFLRKERGSLANTELKIKDTELKGVQKKTELSNKIRMACAEWENTHNQYLLMNTTVERYNALYRAERTRFLEGEGSLFLLNTRETKLLEGELKQMELLIKFYKYNAGLSALMAQF